MNVEAGRARDEMRFYNTLLADALRTAFEPRSLANSSRTVVICSRVSRVSWSTSVAVRPLVGMGGRTGHVLAPRRIDSFCKRDSDLSLTFDSDHPAHKPLGLHIQNPGIILRHHRTDVHPGLDGQMESPLLERQHDRFSRITPRPLGEDEDILSMLLHLPGRTLKGLHGLTPIHAVDEDGAAQAHEPAQEGDASQTLLGRHGAVFGEDSAEEEDVELGLVVADDDHGSLGGEVLLALDDDEADAGGVAHDEVEGAGDGPLGETVFAEQAEGDRGEDAVGGTEEERGVGCEHSGCEAQDGNGGEVDGHGEEGEGEEEVGGDGEQCVVD